MVVLYTLWMIQEIAIYQTDKLQPEDLDGDGDNVCDGFIADLDADGDDGTIRIVVQGDEYRVDLVTRGISRSFPIEPQP